MVAGDQIVLTVDIGSIVAWVQEWRCGYTHVDFLRAGLPHELDETCAGGSTYDRVIDQDDTLALDFGADRVQLDLDEILTLRLSWCDEGSSDVLILDETDTIRDTGLPAVADRGIEAGVRNADHDVCIDRMLLCEELTGTHSGIVYRCTIDDGIRTCEIDILENAGRRLHRLAVILDGAETILVHDHDLTRLEVTHQLRTDCIECTGLTGKYDGTVLGFTIAERTEAMRITYGDQLRRRHDDQREGTVQLLYRIGHRLFDRLRLQTLTRDDIRDRLGIRGGLEDTALQLEVTAKLCGIDQISVMTECHTALHMIYDDRLRIDTVCDAGGGVTHVTAGHLSVAQTVELILRHRLADETELTIETEDTLVVYDDTGRFLATVL